MTQLQAPRRRVARARLAAPVLLLLLTLAAALAAVVALHRSERPPVAVSPPPRQPPGLTDLWSGRASLVLDRKWTSTSLGAPGGGAYSGAHIEVVGGTWYLFNRRTLTGESCPGQGTRMGTDVRASADRGATWGPPTAILSPTPGSAWECAATDGDAVYDARTATWRYLFQCRAQNTAWNGCVAERHGKSPLGPFSAPKPDPNPVITSGQLWAAICDPGDRCGRPPGQEAVASEGTFDIFKFDGAAWWVGFHGFDGTHGYRGIARTASFRRGGWQVDGAGGTPDDAVLGPDDAQHWRESWRAGGPVGAGASSIAEDSGWYYQLAEFPDTNLRCTPGQNWDLGLFRSRLLSSTRWDQIPAGNPVIYSSRAPESGGQAQECNVEYPRLLKDPATNVTYVMHGRVSTDPAYEGIYLYRVEWDRNLLSNGDFGRADAEGWQPFPGTSAAMSVERVPNGSPDGTPYLSFNCGAAACDGRQSVYQDVPVAAGLGGEELAFGGTFRADDPAGRLQVVVHQLDAAGHVIASSGLSVTAGQAYADARARLRVDDRTRRLRFQLYPATPGGLRADNLFVIPQRGCSSPRYPAC